MLFQAVVSGITGGSIYALVALGFVLIYKGTRVVNFGQGEQVMLGAYLTLVLHTFLGAPGGVRARSVRQAIDGAGMRRLACHSPGPALPTRGMAAHMRRCATHREEEVSPMGMNGTGHGTPGSRRASRRRFLRGATITAAVAGSGAWPRWARSQEKDEVVIGFQNDLTGILSVYGYWYDKTAKAVVARINSQGGIAGKKVRLVTEDTESNVNVGLRKLRKLIEEDRADVVLGSLHSGIAIGSAPIVQQLKTVYIPTANAQSITGKLGNRWVFRTITNAEMIAQATVSTDLMKEYGKRWTILYADYAWGQSHVENWTPRLRNIGVEITGTIPVPLQTSDFLPYLAKMDRNSTAMLAVFFASDIIGLLKQRRDLGITVPVMGVTGVTAAVSPDVLKDAAGTLVPESLPRELRFKDTPAIREIRKAIGVDEHGKEIGSNRYLADSYYWATWENIYMFKRAAEEAKWRTKADNAKLIRALEGLKMEEGLEFPQGPKEMRAQDHQAFLDFYLCRINDKGGLDVVKKIDRHASVYPVNPPGTDYTKEPV